MNYKYILVEKVDYKLILTLNRPEKRNAFTPTMINEIHHVFQIANQDESIKVVIIKANGPVFCAGMDLKTFENPDLDNVNPSIQNINISMGEVFDGLYKPSIAIIEGNVIAGAFLIVLGCTYAFCKSDVQFRLPELKLGIFPFQVMESLLKVLPEKKVLQLCLNTNYFDIKEALLLGIVDEYLDESRLNLLIDSFQEVNSKALSLGIKTLRDIQYIPKNERFSYLKHTLDQLKLSLD